MGLFDKFFSSHHGNRGHHNSDSGNGGHHRGYGDNRDAQRPMSGGACPKCGTVSQAGVRFCPQCGTGMVAPQCTKCSAALATDARFCGACGQPRI